MSVPCGPAMLSRRNLSGDPPQGVFRGSPNILAKITGKSRQNLKKKFFFAFFLTILSGFASDLAKKSGDPLRRVSGGSPDNFCRDNIAGPHGTSTKSVKKCQRFLEFNYVDCKFNFMRKINQNLLFLMGATYKDVVVLYQIVISFAARSVLPTCLLFFKYINFCPFHWIGEKL